MQFKDEFSADEYIDQNGIDETLEEIDSGKFGGDIASINMLKYRIKCKKENEKIIEAALNSAKAAKGAVSAAKWTAVAVVIALISFFLQLVISLPQMTRSAMEQMSECVMLGQSRNGDKFLNNEPNIYFRSKYYEECMLASGFEFQGNDNEKCHAEDEMHKSVKQILPSCYKKPSYAHLLGRLF